MTIIIAIISTFFALMALAILFAYYRTGHWGLFLMGIVYGASAIIALVLEHWWPLTAGFALVWVMKLIGLEPEVRGEKKTSDQ